MARHSKKHIKTCPAGLPKLNQARPQTFKIDAQGFPGPSKFETGAVHDSKDAPKMSPRGAFKRHPKSPKTRQRVAQERPRGAQEPPKGHPGGSQTRSKSSPETYSKRFLLQVLLAGLAEQSESNFLIILRCCTKASKASFLHTRSVL